jgi:ADP-ribose pyrophosphatase YjhB (NUDIX family)
MTDGTMEKIMANLGVNIAILDGDKILLTKRDDFEIWCLPGGEVDPNESVAQAAIREAWEETGLTVQLTRLVGVYSRPHWLGDGAHSVLFLATPVHGDLRLCPGETIEVNYFAFDQIPPDLIPWHRQQIQDAFDGLGGSVACRQDALWPFEPGTTRLEIYAQRDRSGLARQTFFLQQLSKVDPPTETVEVQGQPVSKSL